MTRTQVMMIRWVAMCFGLFAMFTGILIASGVNDRYHSVPASDLANPGGEKAGTLQYHMVYSWSYCETDVCVSIDGHSSHECIDRGYYLQQGAGPNYNYYNPSERCWPKYIYDSIDCSGDFLTMDCDDSYQVLYDP